MQLVSGIEHTVSRRINGELMTFKFIPDIPVELPDKYAEALYSTYKKYNRYQKVEKVLPSKEELENEELYPLDKLKTLYSETTGKTANWKIKRETLIANILLKE